jgi:hypothetical protein
MARWLTFDRNTASALRKQLPREQVFEHGANSAVEYASGAKQDLVTLLPTGSTGEVAIAVFRQVAPKPVLVERPAPEEQGVSSPPTVSSPEAISSPEAGPSAWRVVVPEPSAALETKTTTPTPQAQPPSRQPESALPFVRQKAPSTRAGGILGTRDEVVFDDEPKPKRNWWQRFWNEDE